MNLGSIDANSGSSPTSFAEVALLRLRRHGDAPFLLTLRHGDSRDDFQSHSYSEIAGRASALASRLAQSGLARGERVGCYFPNAPSWVVSVLGVWWAGGCPLLSDSPAGP